MRWIHLHHVPGGSRTEGLQGFIDSTFGTAVGTGLHTVGAMAFFAGVLLSWRWVRRGGHGLGLARATTWAGIAFNGFGGLMRLFQSDHPTLSELGTSSWVQLMLVKHVFLVVGMVTAALLATRAPRLDPLRPTAGTLAAVALVAGLVAGGLGALASVAPIPAAAEGPVPDPGAEHMDDAPHGGHLPWRNFTGSATATPLTPYASTVDVEVPAGLGALQADLTWSSPAADLTLEAASPDGSRVAGAGSGATSAQLLVESPGEGMWRFTVSATRAANEAYTLAVRLSTNATAEWTHTFIVAPHAFAEINFAMEADGAIRFGFEVVEDGATVYYNVHSHPGGEVVIHEEGTVHGLASAFTAPSEDIYSVLWENQGAVPVTVTAYLRGRFVVHSWFGT